MESSWVGQHLEIGKSGVLGEGVEAPSSFPILCPVHLFHLAVPELYPFLSFFLFNFYFIFYFLIYFWLCWVFVAARRLSLFAASGWGGYSLLRCAVFSLRWLLLLQSTGSRRTGFSSCGTWAPERRLSSCGAQAEWLRGMWDLPGPGLEPVSPALAGRFLTTAPPGKSVISFSNKLVI